ncbi:MAG: hypothetical protein OEU92_01400 [Alphaproteobacteria bacterium]|nr:hypothetical protein [Alphaproteobacteria bacterium]
MSRILAFLFIFTMFASTASAQVIECPGALPAAHLQKEQTLKVAERMLGRFTAALGLHGLDALDEHARLQAYRDHPEQLLTKLTYLTLQCQMVLLDSTMTADARRRAVRRVFLDYVLQPADPSTDSLAAYVNQVATNGEASAEHAGVDAEIARIDTTLLQSARRQWQERWFIDPPSGKDGKPPRRWSVIIASPRYEDDGWQSLRDHQARFPDIHFELDGPFDLESPHYAVVAGRGLGENTANLLLERIKAKGLPEDSYVWRRPSASEGNGS